MENNTPVLESEIIVANTEDAAKGLTTAIFENTQAAIFSTLKAETREEKIKLYNAVNNSDASLDDNKGKTLSITDMVAHPVELLDEVTGELVQGMRVVLIDEEGKGYHAISQGVVSSMTKIISIVGQGPWKPALHVIPTEQKTRKGFKTLTLQLATK